jgi:hypothetical protein
LYGIVCFLLTMWTLFFKTYKISAVTVGLFPAVSIVPFVLFSSTVAASFISPLELVPANVILLSVFAIYFYLLLLTANVLNGALLYNIPLGQAGRASQFVFSLISSYFLIAFVESSGAALLLRVGIIAAFTFYWTFSALWILKVNYRQVLISTFTITLLLVIAIFSLAVWPMAAIYQTLVLVVIYYVLLNTALEIRHSISSAIWSEYLVLLVLIFIILLALAEWGINGTLL